MEFNNNIPIYMQIMDLIKEEIITGTLAPGEKLPSVREYSKKLKVNPTTIQRVNRELENEGLTYTRRGMGSFITEDKKIIASLQKEMAARLTNDYLKRMTHMGYDKATLVQLIEETMREA